MLTFEQAKELYDFLRGEADVDVQSLNKICVNFKDTELFTQKAHLPKLTDEQAFLVIYALQEVYKMIPDHFEMCSYCGELYDSDEEGGAYDEKNYCGDHIPFTDEEEG